MGKQRGLGVWSFVLLGTLFLPVRGWTQEPAPAPPAETAGPAAPAAEPQAPSTAPHAVPAPAPRKKGKVEYTGPTNVIALPATPMLDEEGKQRTDPEGKLMFNTPVQQQRDKKGHPIFDEKNKPVFQTAADLGYDEKGKKLQVKKEKPPKMVAVSINRGTLTVDGMIGKAALNYEIPDLKYIYLYAPWVGTVVVSNSVFPGAKEQPKAFDQHTLTVTVDDHTFQIYSDKLLLGKKPESAYVAVNRDFKLPSKVPEMGYGTTIRAPYTWPGARAGELTKAPPVPASLRPTQLLSPCPAGQMRPASRKPLPGEIIQPQPCVPIVSGRAATQVPAATPQ